MQESSLIYQQIPKVMVSIGAIGKDRKNPQQGYQFRGIDDLYNACNAVLSEHGVFAVPKVIDIKREERTTKNGGALIYTILTMGYTFYASDGSSFECVTIGEAMDSGDKSCNKAMSAAQKYAFLQVFAIPTEEPKDTENETHTVAPKQNKAPVQAPTQQPAPPPTPPPQQTGDLTARGIVEEVSVKTGSTAKGPWTRYGVKVSGEWYGTFSATVGETVESLKGCEVVLEYKDDGKNKTIVEIIPVMSE